MHHSRPATWLLALTLGFSLAGQSEPQAPTETPTYFTEAKTHWWLPHGQLLLTSERIVADAPDPLDLKRSRALLELGWSHTWGFATGEVAFRSSLGSDGNDFNAMRYDQEPSNGAWLKRATLALPFTGTSYVVSLVVGLQTNPLLSQESLWDHDLSVLGASLRAGWRSEELGVQEAGLRGVKGRVQTFPDAAVDLTALQAVVRLDTGPITWTAHGGRWELTWEAGPHRFKPALPQGGPGFQRLRLDAWGLGLQNAGAWPWELKGIQHRNPANGNQGREFQAWVGGRNRTWIPQAGFVWQQFDFSGTFMPVNGDEWWFTRAAKGPRYLLVLPLPRRCRLTLSHLRHTWAGGGTPVNRSALSLLVAF